jgi:hypothetical protein
MNRTAYRDPRDELRSTRRARPNVFARIVSAAVERRLVVILIWTALAAAGVTYSALTVTLDRTGNGFVALDPEVKASQHALELAFPGSREPIVAVIESADPRAARETAGALARMMASEPRIFSDVFAPGTGRFLDDYGMLYVDAAAVEDTVRRIEQSAPLYHAIAASPNLAGLASLAGEAARAIAAGRSPHGLNVLFAEAALSVKGQIEGGRHDLDWPLLVDDKIARIDSTRWLVLATAVPADKGDPYRTALVRARLLAGEASANAKNPVAITLTGWPVLREKSPPGPVRGFILPALVAGFLAVIILGFGLSRPGLIIALLAAFALGFMAFAGAAVLIASPLDRVTVSAPIIYLAMAALAMTAMMLRSEEHEQGSSANNAALMLSAHRLGPAILAWTIAICAGTFATYLSPFMPLVTLALMTDAATMIVFAASLTLLPAMLGFMPSLARSRTHWLDTTLHGPAPPAWRKFRQGLTATLAVAAILFGAQLPWITIEAREILDESQSRAAQLFDEISARDPSLRAATHVVARPGEEARALAARLALLPEVLRVRSIESFLPSGEGEKRRILARLAGVLPKLPERSAETDEEHLRAELTRLEQSLLDIANTPSTAGELRSAASEFRRGLALLDGPGTASPETIRRLENALFARLPLLLGRVERLSNLPPLSVATLDPEIVHHFVAADGSWRIEISPRDPGALPKFAEAVRAIAPNAAGPAIIDALPAGMILRGLGIAIAGILAMSFFMVVGLARSALAGLRVIIPPVLLTLTAGGGLVLTGHSLSPEDLALVIATLALSVGAGFIAERWMTPARTPQLIPSALPRAVLTAELTLAAAAMPLMLSSSPVWQNFAGLAAMAAGLQILTTLLLVPELARWKRRPGRQ